MSTLKPSNLLVFFVSVTLCLIILQKLKKRTVLLVDDAKLPGKINDAI